MTSFYHTIKLILSDKRISVVIVLLAIVARIVQLTFFYNIRVDGMYQVLGMQNFVDGHGISTSQVLSSDLSKTVYEPLINWPPGYSLLLSPFYVLFNHNYILAGIVLDILAAIGLIFFTRRILRVMDVPTHLINIFTLLTGFFIYYFYFINSSDAIAISFFVMAIYFTLLLLKKDTLSLKAILPLILCLFLSGLIKYLFIPVVFIVPVFLFLKGTADKKRAIQKSGIILFFSLTIMLGSVLIWQKMTSGSATYISESTRGFFPKNLTDSYPFIPASFINPDSAGLVASNNNDLYKIVYRTFQGITLLLSFVALAYVVKRVIKKGLKFVSQHGNFFYLSFFLSAGIALELIILSLRIGKEENYPGHWWTYAEEPRYYGLVAVLIHLSVFLLYHYRNSLLIRSKYIFISLILLLLPEAFRGIFFTAKRIVKAGQEEYSWQYEREIQDYADHIIKKALNRQEGEMAVVTGSSYYINYRVGLYSHIPVFSKTEKINSPALLNTKKPVMLLIILQDNDLPGYGAFPDNNENELAGYVRGFYFYTLHVKPH
ncbi:MAG: hypothetical protein HZB42_13465 [Sphingobacteriales bacterium]|nr:hypothetical protein [Sphingobacteriales bacterium]